MTDSFSDGPARIKSKKKEALWLYSLTDLAFLLMAFFALMLSMSKPDRQQFDNVAGAVQPVDQLSEKAKNLTVVADDLERVIKEQHLEDDTRVQMDANGLVLEFSENLIFTSGSAKASTQFTSTTEKVLRILARAPNRYQISIEGHTDDVPLKSKSGFNSNWELSAARGITLLKLLKDHGMDSSQMRVLALADTQPKVPTEGKTGDALQAARRSNRRVVIRLD